MAGAVSLALRCLPRFRIITTSTGPVTGGQARAAVFGVSDGLVSNISLILGFAGSGVDASVVRLAGLAGLLAGSISMAAGEWVLGHGPERVDRARSWIGSAGSWPATRRAKRPS